MNWHFFFNYSMVTLGEETQVSILTVIMHPITINFVPCTIVVSGDANFVMSSTRLTIGGFTEAGVARSLIEMPSNSEKGLSHRFLWLFPKPLFGSFAALDKAFTDEICKLLQINLACIHKKVLHACVCPILVGRDVSQVEQLCMEWHHSQVTSPVAIYFCAVMW